MSYNSYLKRMPAGIAGAISRAWNSIVEPQAYDPNHVFPRYGMFGKIVSGLFVPLASGDAATDVYGLLVRPFPTQAGSNLLGTSVPPAAAPFPTADVLVDGYMTVFLKLGTAAKNGAVYVVTTAGGTVAVGDIVTAASPAGGGTAVLCNSIFMGPADASGNVEIRYKL